MKSWDSLLTPAEREKIRKFKRQEQARRPLPSVRILAELGDVYGWQAIRDVLENKVDPDLMLRLLRESRNVRRKHLADQYRMMFECVAAAFSKGGDRKINAIIEKLGKDL